ncbi:MAG: L-rhamnonate dehydratase, partial [Deinococcus sp.]|nr:L-rhamnonate dehydratase [Deinococcus sp.]
DVPYTVEMERRLRDYHLSWIEEPLVPDDLDGYAYLTRELPTRISMGEHEYTKYGFKELMERQVADIYQPDVNRVGGLTEAKKICALAEAHHVPILPHSNEAHNLHLIVSSPACTMIEYFPNVEPADGNTMFWKLFTGEVEASSGHIVPPDRPGLGVELNRDALREYRYEG